MIRWMSVVVLISALVSGISVGTLARTQSVEVLDGRELEDLYLISDQSKPDWGGKWSAPIQAATILGWLQLKGHTTLLNDLTRDGVVDVLDAIELADYFGRSPMESNSAEGTTDARLIDTLARYVAERAPDEFEILLYDEGFPAEYQNEFPGVFAADIVPRILLTLEAEPSFEAYSHAILAGLGVIVGIADEDGLNYYLGGRSFLFEPIGEGVNAVDFAWAKEDAWEAGTQGQVLRTVATSRSALHIEFEGAWREVEFMAVLSPIDRPRISESGSCAAGPDLVANFVDSWCRSDAIADEGASGLTEAWFLISNVGDEDSPECEITLSVPSWSLSVDLPSLPAGESVAVLGPLEEVIEPSYCALYSLEVDSTDVITECDEDNNFASGEACCSGPAGDGCPDLAIELVRAWCECPDETFAGDCAEIETACRAHFEVTVTNVGDSASGPFGIWGTDYPDGLAPGESVTHLETFDRTLCHTEMEEHLAYMPVLTGSAYLDEDSPDDCNLANNSLDIPFTCEPPPCSDVAVTIDSVECNCELTDSTGCSEGSEQLCAPIATVTVTNVGGTDTEETTVEVDAGAEAGYSTAPIPALAPGESATLDLGFPGWYTEFCGADPVEFDVDAFVPTSEDCNPANNHAALHVVCESSACPDLSVYVSDSECSCEWIEDPSDTCSGEGLKSCSLVTIVGVNNIGDEDADAFAVSANDGDEALELASTGLPVGGSEYFRFEFSPRVSCGPDAEDIHVSLSAELDGECNVENNEESYRPLCDTPPWCPDLVIEDVRADCRCGPTPQQTTACTLGVTLYVRNLGPAQIDDDFEVTFETTEYTVDQTVHGLDAGSARRLHFEVVYGDVSRILYTITADSVGEIDECDEDNNSFDGSEFCY
ncbi:CARDB domain-containing protein [Candidatus Bipolaricaulota bacterium]